MNESVLHICQARHLILLSVNDIKNKKFNIIPVRAVAIFSQAKLAHVPAEQGGAGCSSAAQLRGHGQARC